MSKKKTKEINLAYDILSDEQSRKNYDMEIAPNPNYSYTPQKYNNPESYSYRNYYTSYEEYENYKGIVDEYYKDEIANICNVIRKRNHEIEIIESPDLKIPDHLKEQNIEMKNCLNIFRLL